MRTRCPLCGLRGRHTEPCPIDAAEREQEARAAERAAIVAWLRTRPIGGTNPLVDGMVRAALDNTADAIEAGAHLDGGKKDGG